MSTESPTRAGENPQRSKTVGFLGPGGMGGPVVEHLLHTGVPVVVFDTDTTATDTAAAHGAAVATDLTDLGGQAATVLAMLPHPDIFREVSIGEGGLKDVLRPGDVIIDMSTDGPGLMYECRNILFPRGIELIDAPVGRGRAAAGSGTLLILAGAEPAPLERVRWLLEIVGDPVLHCGGPGSGQAVKLANNLVSCATVALIAEAHQLACLAGADIDMLYEVLSQTAADSAQLRHTIVAKALQHDFQPEFKLRHAEKDLELVRQLQANLDSRTDCATGALAWYNEAVAASLGDLDVGALAAMADPHLADVSTIAQGPDH